MKLTTEQVDAIERQTGAQPIPADNPAQDALESAFGEHTFYADPNGLHVLEPISTAGADGNHAEVLQIATWASETMDELQPIEPKRTGAVFSLDADAGLDADAE